LGIKTSWTSYGIFLSLILVTIYQLFILIFLVTTHPIGLSGKGFSDSLEYWSALRIWIDGGNPYDPQLMLGLQNSVRPTEQALMMWNPPWLLIIMAPILQFDFQTSAIIFRALNILMFLVSVLLLSKAFSFENSLTEKLMCASLTFFPFWETLGAGQVSVFLLLGISMFMYAPKAKYPYLLETLGFILLTIKPHILYFGFRFDFALWHTQSQFKKPCIFHVRVSLHSNFDRDLFP